MPRETSLFFSLRWVRLIFGDLIFGAAAHGDRPATPDDDLLLPRAKASRNNNVKHPE
jgi:hypothetical protein